MTRQAAAIFLGQVRAEPDLRAKLGPSPSADSYLGVASRAGLDFTVDELNGVASAEQFYQKTIDDPALYARMRSANHEGEVVAMANEMGFECEVADLQAVLLAIGGEELTEGELEAVAGGASFTFPDVCKTPAPPAPFVPIPYPNVSTSPTTTRKTIRKFR